ncbi:hypothetical protein [Thauera chlorobenzoica]|uniref:Uncharacterized protein n=1 Tax=Thauera chlorobenzoica TaxID=96773 RepID=A0A1H5Z1P1_9RHOO|nr:hypothetical protein [Thauera chlorobenzoica]APR05671.1 hypothetical protein Tchl_2848 [Thauera chlorobenzoica]SEG30164.1 hypothetical protein SAMN05216242_13910 [Thauera chlorobenzoica]
MKPTATKTIGEFRAATTHLPNDTPLMVDTGGGYSAPEFYVTEEGLLFDPFPQGD